ncbi:MAG: hypothetical protein ACFFC6_13205 [Promethearchaeota archaeon]
MKNREIPGLITTLGVISIVITCHISHCATQDVIRIPEVELRTDEDNRSAENKAYEYLYETMDKYHTSFDVYSDKDAGGNHFIPSGRMGDWGDIIFEAGCTTNPHSGATCIRIHYSGAGSQAQNWAGIYWQSTESNWGESKGYDLTGATRLTFWARGARGGEKMEFKIGGINRTPHHDRNKPYQDSFGPMSTGIITLSRSWRQYSIDLRGEDLTNVIGGFCWVTNIHQNPRGCLFYLDDIYLDKKRPGELRFLLSYETTAASADKYIRNVAFLYDNAISMIAFMARGTGEDLSRAKIIADAFLYAQNHDRHFTDGRLRNAYQTGDLADFLTGKARLPGWWEEDEKSWFEDEYQVSSYAGNLAWVIIALIQFYGSEGGIHYLNAAERLGDWIFENCYDSSGLGGYMGGYEGWEPTPKNPEKGQTKLTWKSTEHNIDTWCAFMKLYEITSNTNWQERAIHAKKFVEAMWNESEGHFWTGTKRYCLEEQDIINKDALPLDVNTWGLMAIGNLEKFGVVVGWAEKNCYVDTCPKGCGFKGFDFNNDKDGVWFEGTSQMCITYQLLGEVHKSEKLLGEMRKAQAKVKNYYGKGIVAACHDGLTTGFEWVYNNRPHIGATAWFIFAERGFNPYWSINTKEMIPYENVD